jgi:hypothetical protein
MSHYLVVPSSQHEAVLNEIPRMKTLLFGLLLVITFGCSVKKSNDSELIELGCKVIIDSLHPKSLVSNYDIKLLDTIGDDKYLNSLPIERLNSFTTEDIAYMESQVTTEIEFNFKSIERYGIKLFDRGELKNVLFNQNHEPFYIISKPLYSIDKKTAIVNIEFACYDCGHGHIVVMKLENNKWIVKKMIMTWVN